ncbi:MAG TPA: rhodanese-like domain-containing protein [Allosphingosinicella sp.]
MPSYVTQSPAAASAVALDHFERRLGFETDCWDVHESIAAGARDFVVLDVRGPNAFARGHVPGAVHLPHWEIDAERLRPYGEDTLFVVYCAGPHCNGANRGAVRLAQLGRPVKEMIGGVTGWLDEGFDLVAGADETGRRAPCRDESATRNDVTA